MSHPRQLIALRIDPESLAQVDQIAAAKGLNRSTMLREAIDRLIADHKDDQEAAA